MPNRLLRIKEGHILTLDCDQPDSGGSFEVVVGPSRGWWELREVWNREQTMNGLIIANVKGEWYWVRPLGDGNEE